MSRAVVVVRPEPGNSATAAAARALGLEVVQLALFAVRRRGWLAPDAAEHDALILTSANAIRHGGPQLERLRDLPVLAVGAQTAAAARAAGFDVLLTGTGGAARLLRQAERQGIARALHLAGADRTIETGGPVSAIVTVYSSDPLPIAPAALAGIADAVVLLHSARAARRLAGLAGATSMAKLRIAAISPAVLAAAGPGWAGAAVATTPDDAAMLATARSLID